MSVARSGAGCLRKIGTDMVDPVACAHDEEIPLGAAGAARPTCPTRVLRYSALLRRALITTMVLYSPVD